MFFNKRKTFFVALLCIAATLLTVTGAVATYRTSVTGTSVGRVAAVAANVELSPLAAKTRIYMDTAGSETVGVIMVTNTEGDTTSEVDLAYTLKIISNEPVPSCASIVLYALETESDVINFRDSGTVPSSANLSYRPTISDDRKTFEFSSDDFVFEKSVASTRYYGWVIEWEEGADVPKTNLNFSVQASTVQIA